MLFKILHGDDSRISTDITPFHEGWAYVTTSGNFYIDMNIGTVETPDYQRVKLSAKDCETITGLTLDDLKSLISTQDAVILAEAQAYTDAAISELDMGADASAITDVTELPAENINTNGFYRIINCGFYLHGMQCPWVCNIVETLPNEGEPATIDMENFEFYYETTSGTVSGYVDEILSTIIGIPTGWYPMEVVAELLGTSWTGVVYDLKDTGVSGITLLVEYTLYQHIDGRWVIVGDSVGSTGTGYCAEVFNTTRNIAEGDYSHAEGQLTEANGVASHAEGENSVADGDYSHAEGLFTAARGKASHAEGENTMANGDAQHVQGRYNIEDTEEKYAHIVGNGEDGARSNAHTVDWDGNAWFSGKVKVGGTSQDDENAKELATVEYVDSKIGGTPSTPSLIGTWTVIDEPEIPTEDLPLSFASNGTEYMAIGTTSMGSSTWGINALSYQIKDEGYYESAYTNNPSGSYGITHGWSNEAYKTITVTEEPTDPTAIAWLGNNTDAPKISTTGGLPTHTASDEGKFLRIVNGAPAWSSVPNAEDYAF